jgi:hypothetical protein
VVCCGCIFHLPTIAVFSQQDRKPLPIEEHVVDLAFTLVAAVVLSQTPSFERHDIADFPAGYQASVADINGDGKPDVIVLSTDKNVVVWYENPGWTQHPIASTPANIDLAPHDIDGDGRPEVVVASGFYFGDSSRGGDLQWFHPEGDFSKP